MAGLKNSSGDIKVILDDDGQCPMDNLEDLSKEEKKLIFDKLKISKKEMESIKKNYYWDPVIRNEEDYSVDVD